MISEKKLSTFTKAARAKLFNERHPLAVSWAVTYLCNYSCHYCQRWNQKTEYVNTSQAKNIINMLSSLGLARINFTGGEPLLRPEICEWIDYARSKQIKVGMNSNGHFVPKYIDQLKNLNFLTISVEGPQCVHDEIRKEGSFQKVIEAAESAQQHGIDVKFAATINSHNIDYIPELVRLAKQYKTRVTFQPMEGYKLGSKIQNPLVPTKQKFQDAIDTLLSYKKKKIFASTIGNSLLGIEYMRDHALSKAEHLTCAFGQVAFRIEPTGHMVPCALLNNKKFSIDLKEVNQNDIADKIQEIFFPSKKCSCGFCCQRIELNLAWNMKFRSIRELVKL